MLAIHKTSENHFLHVFNSIKSKVQAEIKKKKHRGTRRKHKTKTLLQTTNISAPQQKETVETITKQYNLIQKATKQKRSTDKVEPTLIQETSNWVNNLSVYKARKLELDVFFREFSFCPSKASGHYP